MPTLTVDNQAVEVDTGATILDAARKLGLDLPTLCFCEGLQPRTSCFVCVVKINGADRLLPACATAATDGMTVESETEEVHAARRTALELLLSDHRGDCFGPCQMTCPARMDIPAMIRLIAAGRMEEAVATVKARIPIPAVLGRICPELCEKGCRRKGLDSPVAIRLLKRHVGDYDIASSRPYAPECRAPSGKKVAVIGAGPAGLSAAYYLLQEGHACTVFDAHDEPGGMLRYGVPEEALPREVLDAEIRAIVRLGVRLQSGARVGQDVSLEELRGEFDALLAATGELSEEEPGALGLATAGGRVQADRRTQMTALPGVFVAGSALSPSRHAVRAVGSGQMAARSISQYLAGGPVTGAARPYGVRMGRLDDQQMAVFSAGACCSDRVTPAGGEPAGFADTEARGEAERCLRCDCAGLADCKLREWAMRYGASPRRYQGEPRPFERDATHPDLVYEPGKCIACGLCVQIARRDGERLGLTFVGRGFSVRIGAPLNATLEAGLRQAARECAEACPTGALVLRDACAQRATANQGCAAVSGPARVAAGPTRPPCS